jgi:predicted ester cyclase
MSEANKQLINIVRSSLYDFDLNTVAEVMAKVFHPKALIQLSFPFETLRNGPKGLLNEVLVPLAEALPDLERRDTIVMSGTTDAGKHWVGCCGHYTGTFTNPWLDIFPTGHQISLRFHEFYRVEEGQIVEMQAIWDIPELMMQAKAWPMVPSLGREWHVPGPATQDGIILGPRDDKRSNDSLALVTNMCAGLANFSTGGAEAMELEKYWHPRCNWYGPSGIGTGRGLSGFRNWHQITFLNTFPDRGGIPEKRNMFADGDYVGFTAWPGMRMTVSGDGWLGIAPAGQQITMRSLDFWRCEKGLIRENWVLIDLLDVYHQLGVDVLGRMREFNKAKRLS